MESIQDKIGNSQMTMKKCNIVNLITMEKSQHSVLEIHSQKVQTLQIHSIIPDMTYVNHIEVLAQQTSTVHSIKVLMQ